MRRLALVVSFLVAPVVFAQTPECNNLIYNKVYTRQTYDSQGFLVYSEEDDAIKCVNRQTGTITPGTTTPVYVKASGTDHCNAEVHVWSYTPPYTNLGQPYYRGEADDSYWNGSACKVSTDVQWSYCLAEGCKSSSPVIIDITGNGFHLTDAANGVWFDITGSGKPVKMGWTAGGAMNAFLALPGADGQVHNGTQLFGDHSPQPPSDTPNGFRALAVYDQPDHGGNGDGILDSRDGIWSSLRVWIDANHDGISTQDEMYTLPAVGINSINLRYTQDGRTDAYGNQFRFKTKTNPDKADEVAKWAYDVFFATACN